MHFLWDFLNGFKVGLEFFLSVWLMCLPVLTNVAGWRVQLADHRSCELPKDGQRLVG